MFVSLFALALVVKRSETWCFKSFNAAEMLPWPEEFLEHEGSVVTLQLAWHVQKTVGKHECDGSTVSSSTYSVSICLKKQLMISKTNFRHVLFVSRLVLDMWHKLLTNTSFQDQSQIALLLRTSYDMTACLFHLHVHFDSTHVCMDSIMPMLARVQPFPPWVETARRCARGYLVRLRTHQVTNSWCLDIEGGMSCANQNVSFNTHVSLNATHFGGDHDQTVQINGDFRGFP